MKWPEEMILKSRSFCSIKSKQAGQGRIHVIKILAGQGRIHVIKILAGQVTSYKNTLTCRALLC